MIIPRPNELSLGVVIIMIIMFVLVSADWLYLEYANAVRQEMFIYLFLFIIPLAVWKIGLPSLKQRVTSIGWFAVGALVTVMVFQVLMQQNIMTYAMLASFETLSSTAGSILVTSGVILVGIKAYVEESVFRNFLPHFMLAANRYKYIIANLFFGLFHISINMLRVAAGVITFAELPLIIGMLVMLGFVWTYAYKTGGIMLATGSHFGFNLVALGLVGG